MLNEKLKRYIRQMAPHVASREAGQLLIAASEQIDELTKALEFIAETGGTTHETECGSITCTGSWCGEQARAALLSLPNTEARERGRERVMNYEY